MVHPVRRKGGVGRSKRRLIGNTSEYFRDITAPNRVVAGQLRETAVNADILNRYVTLRAAKMVVRIHSRVEN